MSNLQVVDKLNPKRVWELFAELSEIPRPSMYEEKVRVWLIDFADKNKLKWSKDDIGNLVIYKDRQNSNSDQKLLLQAHMDMVCQKDSELDFDFFTDPIVLRQEDKYIYATKTTLGSDNGIGLCMILAILEDNTLSHPDIQALFTVDEETGMTGVSKLDSNLVNPNYMINLDSEKEGILWVSSAGSRDIVIKFKSKLCQTVEDLDFWCLEVSGLRGGHSGVDIHENRLNAIKLSANLLHAFQNNSEIQITSIHGGNARNAIPRDCKIVFAVNKNNLKLFDTFQNIIEIYKSQYLNQEVNLNISLTQAEKTHQLWNCNDSKKLINFLCAFHSGVHQMNAEIPKLVQTSANLGIVNTDGDTVDIIAMIRSSDDFELDLATYQILNLVESVWNNTIHFDVSDPNPIDFENDLLQISLTQKNAGWKHYPNNPLIDLLVDIHKEVMGLEPLIEAVHAGLECGIMKKYFPNCHIISFGPTIENAHSPEERVEISTVESCFKILQKLVEKLS